MVGECRFTPSLFKGYKCGYPHLFCVFSGHIVAITENNGDDIKNNCAKLSVRLSLLLAKHPKGHPKGHMCHLRLALGMNKIPHMSSAFLKSFFKSGRSGSTLGVSISRPEPGNLVFGKYSPSDAQIDLGIIALCTL